MPFRTHLPAITGFDILLKYNIVELIHEPNIYICNNNHKMIDILFVNLLSIEQCIKRQINIHIQKKKIECIKFFKLFNTKKMNPRDYNKSFLSPQEGMTFIPCAVDKKGRTLGRTTSSLKIRKIKKIDDSCCIVRNCTSSVSKDVNGRSFHYFPSDEQSLRRNAWFRALNINYADSRSVICNLHFTKKCFIGPEPGIQKKKHFVFFTNQF
jgi:hypothetical protein